MFVADGLPNDYLPRPVPLFRPARIVLAKGSDRTEARRRFVKKICEAYPEAEVIEAFDAPIIESIYANPIHCDYMKKASKRSYWANTTARCVSAASKATPALTIGIFHRMDFALMVAVTAIWRARRVYGFRRR